MDSPRQTGCYRSEQTGQIDPITERVWRRGCILYKSISSEMEVALRYKLPVYTACKHCKPYNAYTAFAAYTLAYMPTYIATC